MNALSVEETENFEGAYRLISAIIAAYSALIGRAEPEEATRLRQERAPYVSERQQLRVGDHERVRKILAQYPEVLRQVRESA